MHEIKKNVPLPTSRGQPGRAAVYPFATMKDKDCFDTPIRGNESAGQAVKRMRTVAASYRRRHNSAMAFTVREAVDKEAGDIVIRVWARASVPPVKRVKDVDEFFAAAK